jgi:hypothetical protein
MSIEEKATMTTTLGQGQICADPVNAIDRLCTVISQKDRCFIPAERMQQYLSAGATAPLDDVLAFQDSWNDLPRDEYMADGGRYRSRRHATLSALPSSHVVYVEPHQPHYQSLSYNKLNGDVARHFQPIAPAILHGATMSAIDASLASEGKPTPEGVHRDGVCFVLMLMVKRNNVVNGCTDIYDLDRQKIDSFTLTRPFDAAIVNDRHVFHGVTPIIQLDVAQPATRDVLVVTFRKK